MARFFAWLSKLGHISDEELGAAPPVVPFFLLRAGGTNGYVLQADAVSKIKLSGY